MSKNRRQRSSQKSSKPSRPGGSAGEAGLGGVAVAERRPAAPVPEPVDVVDGIPDRDAAVPAWKYLALAGVFTAWTVFLVYVAMAGT
jgi:hypothetical protein